MAHAWHGHFEPKRVPVGVWMRCDGCGATLFRKEVERNLNVCPQCDHHFSVPAAERIAQLLDPETFEEWYPDLRPGDPLGFNDRRPYPERVRAEQERTGLNEAAAPHHRNPVGHRQRLGLIVGHVDHRPADLLVDVFDLGAHIDAKLGVQVR